MGMIGCFRRLAHGDWNRLAEDPSRISEYLGSDSPGEDARFADLDVDKAWHGIHFLLTGSASEGTTPLHFILGGSPMGEEDLGYGPARGFSPPEVKQIAEALSPLTTEVLAARYDPEKLAASEVYPGIWADEGDEARDYLIDFYEQLRAFVAAAAAEQQAMLVFMA
jgi:hypothetical protein